MFCFERPAVMSAPRSSVVAMNHNPARPCDRRIRGRVPYSHRNDVTRRRALVIAPIAAGGLAALFWRTEKPSAASAPVVTIVEFSDDGVKQGAVQRRQVLRSERAWRGALTAQQFWVTRRGTTDTLFTGTFYQQHAAGLYRCVCCANAVFSSGAKFDSGTGWLSYWAPLAAENIFTQIDASFGMTRTEVLCRLCDAHLGHVFDDGPPPTHLRYCINESALRFVSRASA
jgi:peptide-methionine (R)-S-oxide reductase